MLYSEGIKSIFMYKERKAFKSSSSFPVFWKAFVVAGAPVILLGLEMTMNIQATMMDNKHKKPSQILTLENLPGGLILISL
jgi:hypothetical protein